jgi:MYXO-CTERM domain-containing protein
MHRTLRRAAALATGLTLVTAGAAWAHPAFNPNEVPGGEAVETDLVIPHGCNPQGGMPEEGAATATTRFELQLSDAVASFEAGEVDGWEVSREGEVVTWTDAGGATTDPITLPVTLSLAGDSGDELYLKGYQECAEGGDFRWIGTPDEEAEFPAVKLTLTSGAVGTAPVTEDHSAHGGDMGSEDMAGMDDPTSEDAPSDAGTTLAAEDAASDDDAGAVVPIVIGLLVLVVAGAAVLLRRRGAA